MKREEGKNMKLINDTHTTTIPMIHTPPPSLKTKNKENHLGGGPVVRA
jgi:hypothetical protein